MNAARARSVLRVPVIDSPSDAETRKRASLSLMPVMSMHSNLLISSRLPHDLLLNIRLPGADFHIAIRRAEVSPIDIGPQVFTANDSACGLLDSRAAFGGYRPITIDPLIDRWRLDAQYAGQRGLPANLFARDRKLFFAHATHYKASPYMVSIGIA